MLASLGCLAFSTHARMMGLPAKPPSFLTRKESMMSQDPFETLKLKYQSVLNFMNTQNVQLQNLNMEGNKLFIRASAPSQDVKNQVWDQIKLVDPNYSDLVADIRVEMGASTQTAGAAAGGGQREFQTYIVQTGDTLSKISQQFYGDASQYQKIFQANRDKLTDPNKIQVGQKLTIP